VNDKKEFLDCLDTAIDELTDIWDEVGIVGDHCDERKGVLMFHLSTLLEEMVREERDMKVRILENVERYITELEKLNKELCLPEFVVSSSFSFCSISMVASKLLLVIFLACRRGMGSLSSGYTQVKKK